MLFKARTDVLGDASGVAVRHHLADGQTIAQQLGDVGPQRRADRLPLVGFMPVLAARRLERGQPFARRPTGASAENDIRTAIAKRPIAVMPKAIGPDPTQRCQTSASLVATRAVFPS